jgi:tellurite resistance-related uncharacterized protein
MSSSAWQKRISEFFMPWWKKTQIPEAMQRPDTRTEAVLDRLEIIAARLEKVSHALEDELDEDEKEARIRGRRRP